MKGYPITLAVLLATGTASAGGFMPWTDAVKMADTNGDHMLTPTEVMYFNSAEQFPGFQPWMSNHFKDFDTDGDGMVSMDELKAAMAKHAMDDEQMSRTFHENVGFMPTKTQ